MLVKFCLAVQKICKIVSHDNWIVFLYTKDMLQISQKTFLLGGLVLFLLASAVLFTLHNRALDPERSASWWAVRFVSLDDRQSLSFEIENHSEITTGKYTVFVNGVAKEEHPLDLGTTPLHRFMPEHGAFSPEDRIRIVVTLGDEEKSLIR